MKHVGFHGRAGFGERPALLVIDVNLGFTDPASPLVCELDDVVAAIRRLLDEFRRAQLPVVYTTVSYGEGDKVAAAAFIDKIPALLTLEAGSRWVEIDPRIAPLPSEPVLNKLFASAFYGTPLSSLLASAGCDSVVVTGASTSGCVRATAVDAFSTNIKTTIVEEGCFDRSQASHAINLCDMQAKYADVVNLEEVLQFVNSLPSGLFDLPKHGAFQAPKLASL